MANRSRLRLLEVDHAQSDIQPLSAVGPRRVFSNGPQVSDFVVIPMRASGLDLLASQDAVRLCQDAEVAYMVVFNACQRRAKDKLVDAARFSGKVPIADTAITQRVAFVTAMTTGKTGAEKDAAAGEEIEALWKEIKSATLKAYRTRMKKVGA